MMEKNLEEKLNQFSDGTPKELRDAMQYSLLASGKRFRPLLVLLGNRVGAGEESDAIPAACAVEMVHTYSLIHDDLPAMDDDDFRRGKPTCHKKFSEATAILAGDALLTLAFQILAQSYPASIAAVCVLELAVGAGPNGMVGGQMMDLQAENHPGLYNNSNTPVLPPATSIASSNATSSTAASVKSVVASEGISKIAKPHLFE